MIANFKENNLKLKVRYVILPNVSNSDTYYQVYTAILSNEQRCMPVYYAISEYMQLLSIVDIISFLFCN